MEPQVLAGLIVTLPYLGIALGAEVVLARSYARAPSRTRLLFLIAQTLYAVLAGVDLVNVFQEEKHPLRAVRDLLLMGMFFFYIWWADAMSRDAVEPGKLALFTFLVGMSVIGRIEYYGSEGSMPPYLNMIGYAYYALGAGTFLYICVQLHRHAPGDLKASSRFVLAGGILTGVVATIMGLFFPLQVPTPGGEVTVWLSQPIQALGVLLTVYGLARAPALVYVLPSRVLRLMVLDLKSGIPLFAHTWQTRAGLADEDLFSGMLQGVSMIVREAVNRGNVQEILLERAVLVIRRVEGSPVTCILVTTRASARLREALGVFASRFVEEYGDALKRNPNNVTQFHGATGIVAECFPFVPEYGAAE